MNRHLQIVPSGRGRPPTDGLRERILAVGERIFAGHDFHEVRMDDVAEACGVAKGTLYLYFPGKRGLYRAVMLDGSARLRAALDDVAKAPRRPLDRLAAMVTCLLERRESRLWLRRHERTSRIIQAVIRRATSAGELRSIDPRVATEMLLGIVRGFASGRSRAATATRDAGRAMDVFLRGAGPVRGRSLARRSG